VRIDSSSQMLKVRRGGRLTIWPNPIPQTLTGGGGVGLAVVNLIDQLQPEDYDTPLSISLFSAMFLLILIWSTRILLARIVVDSERVKMAGIVVTRTVQRGRIVGVRVGDGASFRQIELAVVGGGKVVSPMALNGSDNCLAKIARVLADELGVELEESW
jgi:hypothetical protein